jgi:PST family polysaccharide transporter
MKMRVRFEFPEVLPSDDLRGRTVRGGAFTVFSQGVRFFTSLAALTILGRLLTPADFGLVAMVTALTGLAMIFRHLGLGDAAVQRERLTPAQSGSLFWVNTLVGLLTALIFIGLARPIAWFYDEPRLVGITMLVSISFVFGGMGVQYRSLLRRQLRFRTLMQIDLAVAILTPATTVAMAVSGAGYWAIAIFPVVNTGYELLMLVLAAPWWPPRLRRGTGVRDMLQYGGNVTLFTVTTYFTNNLDKVLIGRIWGDEALGFYSRAYNLLLLPLLQINAPVTQVALPALSRVKAEPERHRRVFLAMMTVISSLATPLSLGCLVFAEPLVLLVLGPQWGPSVPIFRLLAISAVLQPIFRSLTLTYLSLGRTWALFQWGAFHAVWICMVVAATVPYGTHAVALGYALAMWAAIGPALWLATRGTAVTVGDLVRSVAWPITASLLAGLPALGFLLLVTSIWPHWAILLAGGGIYGLGYAVILLAPRRARQMLRSLLTEFRMRGPRASEV